MNSTLSLMRSMNGAGQTPMKTIKTMSSAPPNCSPRRISFIPAQRSLKGPKNAIASMRSM